MIYDISRAVTPKTAVFPGDTPYQVDLKWRIAKGAPVNLVSVTTTPHIGTHADAYFHYVRDGAHPIHMPLESYIGRCRVMTVTRRSGGITPADLPAPLAGAERLLLHTWMSDSPDDKWMRECPYVSVELIHQLAAHHIVLVGIDTPSVDDLDSAELPGHKAIVRHRLVNLENLALKGVPDGDYELVALPLKLDLACASPVRAILRTLD
jgi:arylformamidase